MAAGCGPADLIRGRCLPLLQRTSTRTRSAAGDPPRAHQHAGGRRDTTSLNPRTVQDRDRAGLHSHPRIDQGDDARKGLEPRAPNDDWASHDLAHGADNGDTYPRTLATRYGEFNGLVELYARQLMNYEAHRALYEGRLSRMFNPSNAVFLWMSNPSQPSFTWQIYSYDLEPFGSFFGAKRADEVLHVQMNQSDFHVMVINHLPKEKADLRASVRVFDVGGNQKYQNTVDVSAAASAATDLGAIDFPQDLSPVHFVKLELRDSQKRLVSDNFYWRSTKSTAAGEDLSDLDTMPTVTVDAKIVRHDSNGKCLLDVTLTNPTHSIAMMTHIQLRKQSTNQRVLPVFYSDNYVTLLPNESRTISVEASAKDLANDRPLVVLDGWNVTTRPQSFAGHDDGASITRTSKPACRPERQRGLTRGRSATKTAAGDGWHGLSARVPFHSNTG